MGFLTKSFALCITPYMVPTSCQVLLLVLYLDPKNSCMQPPSTVQEGSVDKPLAVMHTLLKLTCYFDTHSLVISLSHGMTHHTHVSLQLCAVIAYVSEPLCAILACMQCSYVLYWHVLCQPHGIDFTCYFDMLH